MKLTLVPLARHNLILVLENPLPAKLSIGSVEATLVVIARRERKTSVLKAAQRHSTRKLAPIGPLDVSVAMGQIVFKVTSVEVPIE